VGLYSEHTKQRPTVSRDHKVSGYRASQCVFQLAHAESTGIAPTIDHAGPPIFVYMCVCGEVTFLLAHRLSRPSKEHRGSVWGVTTLPWSRSRVGATRTHSTRPRPRRVPRRQTHEVTSCSFLTTTLNLDAQQRPSRALCMQW
jgi:hypothetical protein